MSHTRSANLHEMFQADLMRKLNEKLVSLDCVNSTMQLPDEMQEPAIKTVPLSREMPMGNNSTQGNMSAMRPKTHRMHPTIVQRQIWRALQ